MSKAKLWLASVLAGAAMTLSPLVAGAQNADQGAHANASGPQKLVDQSTQVVQRMQQDQNLRPVLARAQGVLIIPNYSKGAFIVGGKGGEGVLLVHENGGRWSSPAFYGLSGAGIGAQVGGEGGPIAYILMSPNAVRSLVSKNNVSLNANSGFTIATWSGKTQGNIGTADVVLWSGAKGALGSAAVGASNLSQDRAANDQYYRAKNLNTVAVLQGRVSNPGAAPLQQSLSALG
jgi:lipid-binding SYLF domain-containing protein